MSDDKTQHLHGNAPAGKGPSSDNLATQPVFAKSQTAVAQLEIVEGLGAGNRLPVYTGTNALGRDPTKQNRIVVDFGDTMIGRDQHAFITHDAAARVFGIQGNGHPNPILLNGKPVTTLVRLMPGDQLKIGQTTFRLLA